MLSVVSLLNEPNTSSPANVDASVMYRKWKESDGKETEYANIIKYDLFFYKLHEKFLRACNYTFFVFLKLSMKYSSDLPYPNLKIGPELAGDLVDHFRLSKQLFFLIFQNFLSIFIN